MSSFDTLIIVFILLNIAAVLLRRKKKQTQFSKADKEISVQTIPRDSETVSQENLDEPDDGMSLPFPEIETSPAEDIPVEEPKLEAPVITEPLPQQAYTKILENQKAILESIGHKPEKITDAEKKLPLLLFTKKEIKKAIILSEILGAPRAERPY